MTEPGSPERARVTHLHDTVSSTLVAGMAEMRGSQSQILAKFGKLFLEDMASCSTKRAFGEQSSFPFSAPLWVGGSARYVTGELLIQAGERESTKRRDQCFPHFPSRKTLYYVHLWWSFQKRTNQYEYNLAYIIG